MAVKTDFSSKPAVNQMAEVTNAAPVNKLSSIYANPLTGRVTEESSANSAAAQTFATKLQQALIQHYQAATRPDADPRDLTSFKPVGKLINELFALSESDRRIACEAFKQHANAEAAKALNKD